LRGRNQVPVSLLTRSFTVAFKKLNGSVWLKLPKPIAGNLPPSNHWVGFRFGRPVILSESACNPDAERHNTRHRFYFKKIHTPILLAVNAFATQKHPPHLTSTGQPVMQQSPPNSDRCIQTGTTTAQRFGSRLPHKYHSTLNQTGIPKSVSPGLCFD
jgi:hypothetical protein